MPPQTHHEKGPRTAKGTWVFLLLYLTLLPGHIRLITCPLRWPDMIMITPQACLAKPRLAAPSFVLFLVKARACDESRNWCYSTLAPLQGRLLVLSFVFKGFSLLLEKLVTSRSFDEMPCATWATQKYVVIIVVGSSWELALHPNQRIVCRRRYKPCWNEIKM